MPELFSGKKVIVTSESPLLIRPLPIALHTIDHARAFARYDEDQLMRSLPDDRREMYHSRLVAMRAIEDRLSIFDVLRLEEYELIYGKI